MGHEPEQHLLQLILLKGGEGQGQAGACGEVSCFKLVQDPRRGDLERSG